jgi:hypothetical protein
LNDKPRFPLPLSQTFAPNSSKRLEPGLEVVMVGHPFKLGTHSPSAIWKGAMVASDWDAADGGRPWILLDAPGVPGMSGSPALPVEAALTKRQLLPLDCRHHAAIQYGSRLLRLVAPQ